MSSAQNFNAKHIFEKGHINDIILVNVNSDENAVAETVLTNNENLHKESEKCPSPTLSVSTMISTNNEQKHKKKTREVPSRYMQSISGNSNAASNKNQDIKKNTISKPAIEGNRPSIKPIKTVQKQLGISHTTVQKRKAQKIFTNLNKNQEQVSQDQNKATLQDCQSPTENRNLDDELIMLNARLTQWCLLNAKAEQAFEHQKRTAEVQLLDAWELLVKKQEELSKANQKFTLEKEIIFLNTTLKIQRDILLQINEHFEKFKKRYILFASSLASTTTAMPIANIITGELDQLKNEIITCSIAAEDVLRKWDMESPLIHDVARSMHTLCMNIKKEIQELNECNALLREISEAETIEASLRIQKLETINNKYQSVRLD
ncbi:5785_t:CDS:10 [Funneliformis geosporum]|nr:5785_t:CDS:10 [Funneliformis geosporum]